MLHKLITVCILLMIFFISALFYANLIPVFLKKGEEKHLSYNDVAGVSFFYQGKEYPLNFEQQNQFLFRLNSLEKANFSKLLHENLDLEQIIVYRFGHPNLVIEKIPYVKNTYDY